ncbi:putative glucose 1-dehydrogenase [uncultured delta proteobacterium]|uniref:Putative glucose 1-dehydrogenase n=1 Tax=uncultured delta proteobacterium TaxID=34034 RepID=A0A212JVK3_9DELT|nr:putative glucose 1-dehydrogenase [uncultured delta proteobacterium]
MDLNLKGKVAVITGGSEGIGRAVAMEFLKEGCKVAVSARRQAVLDDFYRECVAAGFGDNAMAVSADVTDTKKMAAFRDAVKDRFGKIDIWVNNAGRSTRKALMDISDQEWDECLDLNLTSAFKCCRLAVEEMRKTGGGVIINALSFSTRIPVAGNGPYAIAKSGLKTLTSVLAAEVAPDNIRVVGFTPGFIETPLTASRIAENKTYYAEQCPAGRVGVPADLAPAIVFLASDLAGYVTGTDLAIAGGKFCVQNPMYGWKK